MRYLLTLCLLSIALSGWTQSCLPGGITFTTQAQIDSFPINYPGCSEIEGFVEIRRTETGILSKL